MIPCGNRVELREQFNVQTCFSFSYDSTFFTAYTCSGPGNLRLLTSAA